MPFTDAIKGPPPPHTSGWGGGGEPGKRRRASLTGIYVVLAAVTMFFAALTSALVVRRGIGAWTEIPLPPVLWLNTAVLVVSSAALELAQRSLNRGVRDAVNRWWTAGTALGLLFLGGQYYAWRQVAATGVTAASSPGGAFFYLFTFAHAVHVLGGVAALLYIEVQALRLQLGPGKRTAVEVTRLYWHFLAGLWIYLMLLFTFWG
jgi:cytochrome c oxidase subunit 3